MKISSGPIGNLNPNLPINIVGAGFAGLVMGYYLKKSGFQVQIFEKNTIGGKIATTKTKHGLVESAANAVYTNEDVLELITELELSIIKAPKKLKKWVFKNKKPSKPIGFFDVLKIVFGLFRRVNSTKSESMFDLFKNLLGEKLAYDLLSAAFGGVYAIDSKKLYWRSVFKIDVSFKNYFQFIKLVKKLKRKSTHKPMSVSFEGGNQKLIDALKESLKENIKIQEVTSLTDEENWIVCTEASNATHLFSDNISKQLSNIEYIPLTTMTVFSNECVHYLKNSFGIVIPPSEGLMTKGVLSNSEIFSGRTNQKDIYSYTFIIEGIHSEDSDVILAEIKSITKLDKNNIISMKATPWPLGLPAYTKKRHESILQLRSLFIDINRKVLFGNYTDGISLREMISQAKEFALDLEKKRKRNE